MTMLNDGKAIEKIAKLKAQDKGLWNKIKNFITGLVNKIKAAYKGVQPYSREGIMLSEALGNLEQLQEMWTEALIDAGDAYSEAVSRSESAESSDAEGEDAIRFSLMNGRGLSENVDAVLNMSAEEARKNVEEGNFVSIMKETPSIILNNVNDAENLEIIIRFDAFYLATRKEGVIEGHYHDYGEIIKKLPEIIANPEAIVRMDNGRLNLISTLAHPKGNNNTVSIELNTVKDINSKYSKYNLVVSVFASKDNYVRNNLTKRGVKVEYSKEDLSQVNPQLYKWLAIVNDKSSKNSIRDFGENVKPLDEKFPEEVMSVLSIKQATALSERGVQGDALLNATDLAKDILEVDGKITDDAKAILYHGTTRENAKKIIETGKMYGKEDAIFFSTKQDGIVLDYGEAVIEAEIPLEKLELNDIFDSEVHLNMKVRPNTLTNIRFSDRDDARRITADMTDTDRAEILRKKEIVAPVYKGEADASIEREGGLEKQSKSFIKDALERIGKEFEVFTEYDIKDVDLKIILSANNLRESIHKEATPAQIAKLLPVLRDTLENAKGIERHNNRYYYDNYTVDFENLLGAYIDGEYIVPVRFGLKHGKMGETTLYVLIDQEKIKAEVIKKAPSIIKLKPSSSRSAYVYSIAQIVPFVNSKDLLRYLPDDMLNASQREIKWQGIAETIEYTNNKNDAKYTKFISERKLDAAKLMVKTAAEANGYKLKIDGDISYYRTEDGKSKKSAETITYDDNDNVIPISKRFDTQNEDEKYSVRDSYDEYSKQNAQQIISSITYNALKFNDGSVGKIEGKAELADIIWRKLNTTDYQDREYAASELAEEVIKRVTVKADNPDKAMYADTVKAIKPYLHSFNLDAIRADIEHRYGKNEAKGSYRIIPPPTTVSPS